MTAAALRQYHSWPPRRSDAGAWAFPPLPASSSISAYDIHQPSGWVPSVLEAIDRLMALTENWDSYGGRPVRRDVAAFTLQLLSGTMLKTTPAPQIVPLPYGGLQLEWHEGGIDLEIEVMRPNRLTVYFEDQANPETSFDVELSADFSILQGPIARLIN